jgi:hypothetical protein
MGREELLEFHESDAAGSRITIHADKRASHVISKYLTGKFCEHLESNIYNGMCAQIVRNPTFAAVPFSAGIDAPDGGRLFAGQPERVREGIRHYSGQAGWPGESVEQLVRDHGDGLALFPVGGPRG